MPCSMAFLPASSAAICAAKGVDLRLPLNPIIPADDQAIALPCASAMVIMVLLNVEFTWATPDEIFFRSLRLMRVFSFAIRPEPSCHAGAARKAPRLLISERCYFFLPAIALAGPLRVRALVWVRWPRTGRPLRCRRPR